MVAVEVSLIYYPSFLWPDLHNLSLRVFLASAWPFLYPFNIGNRRLLSRLRQLGVPCNAEKPYLHYKLVVCFYRRIPHSTRAYLLSQTLPNRNGYHRPNIFRMTINSFTGIINLIFFKEINYPIDFLILRVHPSFYLLFQIVRLCYYPENSFRQESNKSRGLGRASFQLCHLNR